MFSAYWRIAIKPHWRAILMIGAASFAAGVAEVGSVALVIPVVALFQGGESPSGRKFVPLLEAVVRGVGLGPGPETLLFVALAGVAVLILLKSALGLLVTYLTAHLSETVKRTLTVRMFRTFASARYAELTRRSRGEILQDIQGPPDTLGYVIHQAGLSLAAAGQLFLILGFLAWLSPWLTVAVGMVGGTFIFVFRGFIQHRVAQLGRADYALTQQNTKLTVEALDGMRVVKIHNLADRFGKRLQEALAKRSAITVNVLWLSQTPKIVFELAGVLIVVMLVGLSMAVPALRLDFPALAAFVLAMRQITPTASTLNTALINAAHKWRQIGVIEETLGKLPQEDETDGADPLPPVIHSLSLEAVSFAYPDHPDRKVAQDLSLSFTRGRVTALVGSTGAGKTTIADLIIRLWEPDGGRIVADGIDIRRFSLSGWRARLGYVGQDIFLFNATIGENITALDDSVPAAEIVRAAQLAQIDDFIAALPQGYGTVVGDRGVKLSGGQRQRLAVARAILRRPNILILDEATSALDTLTERAIHAAIACIRREAIVIVIAHRLTTVADADEIVVLQNGQVAEQGTHNDLLSKQGLYWRLSGNVHAVGETDVPLSHEPAS